MSGRSPQRWNLGVWGLIWLMGPLTTQAIANPERICPQALGPQLESIIAQQPDAEQARWGILVQTLDSGETLYAREATRYFIPASNAKLLTTAAALVQLGPTFRMRTSVYQMPSAEGRVVRVVGRGDPSLEDEHLRHLARQLRDRGLTSIDQLIVDDTYLRGDPINPNWEWEDIQAGYGAPVSSLMVNRNAIELSLVPQQLGEPLRVVWPTPGDGQAWRIDNQSQTVATSEPEFTQVGRDPSGTVLRVQGQLHVGAEPAAEAIAVVNPAQHFLYRFEHVLAAEGIAVGSRAIASASMTPAEAADAVELAAVDSPPLADLILEANQTSENLYAEALLRQLGHAANPSLSSLEAGLAAIEATLATIGVQPEGYALADGSGLARKNLASPLALVQVLRAMAHHPDGAIFWRSLAVAGVSGTLRNRLQGTPAEGRMFGKTGAISGIAALSGYVTPPDHPPLAFSILVNHINRPVRTLRPALDDMVAWMARLHPCDATRQPEPAPDPLPLSSLQPSE